jgi:hypothetical protein
MPFDQSIIANARATNPTVLGYLRSAGLLLKLELATETSALATATTTACATGEYGALKAMLDDIRNGINVLEHTGSKYDANFKIRVESKAVFTRKIPKATPGILGRLAKTIGFGLSVIRRMVMTVLWVLGFGLSVAALLQVGAWAVDARELVSFQDFAPSWNSFWAQPRCALEDELRANSTLMREESTLMQNELKGEITKLKSMYSTLEAEREKQFKDVLTQVAKESKKLNEKSNEEFQARSTAVLGEFKGQSTAVVGEIKGKAEAMLGQINDKLKDTATELTHLRTVTQDSLDQTTHQVLENYKHIAASEKRTQKLDESVGKLSVKFDELSEKDEWYAAKMEANEQRAMELGEKISELGRFFEYVLGADGKFTWIFWLIVVSGLGIVFFLAYVQIQMTIMHRQFHADPPPADEQAAPPVATRGRGRPKIAKIGAPAQAPIPDPIPAPAGSSYDTVRKIVSDLANTMSDLAKIMYYLGWMLVAILVAYCAYQVKVMMCDFWTWTGMKSVPQQLLQNIPGKMTSAMTSAVGDAVTGLLNQTSGNAVKLGFRG